jgi:hypothetical protein
MKTLRDWELCHQILNPIITWFLESVTLTLKITTADIGWDYFQDPFTISGREIPEQLFQSQANA